MILSYIPENIWRQWEREADDVLNEDNPNYNPNYEPRLKSSVHDVNEIVRRLSL